MQALLARAKQLMGEGACYLPGIDWERGCDGG